MLEHLHIRNLALIEDMTLEFGDGINVLTGETGAGKSFILKALGFLMGDKLGADIVRPGAERAQVEAIFRFDGKDLLLKREITANSGRSRFYINDSLSSQEALRELREKLLSHTSQHAQQQLLQPAFQAQLLEKYMEVPDLVKERANTLAKLKEIAGQIKEIEQKQAELIEKRELLELQKAEIEKVNPQPGEEEDLESMRTRARADIGLKQNYNKAMAILHGDDGPGLLQMLQDFERLVAQISGETGSEDELTITTFRQQLARMASSLPKPHSSSERVDMDRIEERLFAFAQLKRKLKRSLPEILALQEEIKTNLSFLDVCALDLGRLKKEQNKYAADLEEVINKIKPHRYAAADKFARKLEQELKELGFSEHLRVVPEFTDFEVWPGIKDIRGVIKWAPNPGQNEQPLDKIASGGELSRFLLALNTLDCGNEDLAYIFDEVDAGVGGMTLNKLADKLDGLAKQRQIILITHWPQLASRAKTHFLITKIVNEGKTYTLCAPLSPPERKSELLRMQGGKN